MEKINKPTIEIDGEEIEIDDIHDEDWLDDNSVSDEEKLAYFQSLDWKPVRNLATEFGITSQEQYDEYVRKHGKPKFSN